ncbi:hypothetical protein vBCtySFA88_00075 [Clostridium phage vB_CtyS-FA88]|nr:hypothetical protein vBCtySFA88_00075 [Clostridium phage vB_CtyS-FA88]
MKDVDRFKNIVATMTKIFEAKNADYGNSFGKLFEEYGTTSLLIRLEDKLNRLKTLANKDFTTKVRDESITDTLLDLANYAILGKIALDKFNEKAKERTDNFITTTNINAVDIKLKKLKKLKEECAETIAYEEIPLSYSGLEQLLIGTHVKLTFGASQKAISYLEKVDHKLEKAVCLNGLNFKIVLDRAKYDYLSNPRINLRIFGEVGWKDKCNKNIK